MKRRIFSLYSVLPLVDFLHMPVVALWSSSPRGPNGASPSPQAISYDPRKPRRAPAIRPISEERP